VSEPQNNSNSPRPPGSGNNRRRRSRGNRGGGQGQGSAQAQGLGQPLGPNGEARPPQGPRQPRPPGQQNQPRPQGQGQGPRPQGQGQGPRPQGQSSQPRQGQGHGQNSGRNGPSSRSRRGGSGRVLTSNQILVKYDNLLEQHLITRRKYFEYFNRSDERQLYRLEKNFYDSIEHLRRFEASLEPWQREALEQKKTERYRPDLTYSNNRNLDTSVPAPIEVAPEEIEDPHFKESQKEAFDEYKEDTEESEGTYEDYLRLKGL
jgi:hypothetical protein